MPEKRSIEIHSFNIHVRSKPKDRININEFDINGAMLPDILSKRLVDYIDNLPNDNQTKRTLQMATDEKGTVLKIGRGGKEIAGKILTGQYNKMSDVIDVNNKLPVFNILKHHSVQKPFYFHIILPDKKPHGYILLERDGVEGIKEVFLKTFQEFIRNLSEDHDVKFENFIDSKIVENYLEHGAYKGITLTRHYLPSDIADQYGLGKFETDDYTVELRIKSKRNKFFPKSVRDRILRILNEQNSGYFTSEEFSAIGFDSNSLIKVKSTFNDKERTINLTDFNKQRPYYPISIGIDSKGHSDFDSIHRRTKELFEEFNLDLFSE